MFSFFSQVKVKRVLFACLVLVLLACFLGSCKNEVEDVNEPGSLPDGLVGKWVASYGDFYEITRSNNVETLKYDSGYGSPSQGTIRFVSNYDSKSGVIIVEYTSGLTNANRPFGAVYYLDLTSTTAGLSSAWDSTAADYDANTVTLQDAIEKFTKGNIGNYLDLSQVPTYTKQ